MKLYRLNKRTAVRTKVSCRIPIWEQFEKDAEDNAFIGVGRGEAEFATSRSFDYARWRRHASSTRYSRDLAGLLVGNTTRRIFPALLLLFVFSCLVEAYGYASARKPELPEIQLPIEPFQLTAPLIGLLLVFRTNSSYQRYNAASRAIHGITAHLRDILRQLVVWKDKGSPRAPADAQRLCKFIVHYYCWLCTSYLQSKDDLAVSRGNEALKFMNRQLGRGDCEPLTPPLVHAALSWEVNRQAHLALPQQQGIENTIVSVGKLLGDCEHLLWTPIPLAYTRSLVRFLWLWLSLLPFALVHTYTNFDAGTWWEGKPLVVVPITTLFVSIMFLSLEDIAVQIEQPFVVQSNKLNSLTTWFEDDAVQMNILITQLEAATTAE